MRHIHLRPAIALGLVCLLCSPLPASAQTPPAPAPAAGQGSAAAGQGPIIGNKRTHIYHLPGDGHLPGEKNRVYFQTEAEAQAAGYHKAGSPAAPAAGTPSSPAQAPPAASPSPTTPSTGIVPVQAPPSLPSVPGVRVPSPAEPPVLPGQPAVPLKADAGGYNMAAPIVPDPKLTPGAALPVTMQDIAVPGYTKKVRNVPESVKRQVYAEYGITSRKRGEYEVDHLISLELGGSNSLKNLWPESYKTQPLNAHVKDRLENKMHELVVAGKLDLATAQKEEAADWVGAYKKYVGPLPTGAGATK